MKHIDLDMNDYKPRQETIGLTQQEKIARLYELANKIHVQIGTGRRNHDRDPRFLPKES